MIDDDRQVGVSSCDHSRDACLEVSFLAKKDCRSSSRWPTGIDVLSCAVVFTCNGTRIPRIERFERVCSEWKSNARASGGSICDVLLSAQLTRLIRHIVSECGLNDKVKKGSSPVCDLSGQRPGTRECEIDRGKCLKADLESYLYNNNHKIICLRDRGRLFLSSI